MRRSPLLLALFLTTAPMVSAAETLPDNFLATTSYEFTSLGEIYLALPQQLFELTYLQRVEFLIKGYIQFDPEKKQIYVPGDGGQQRITARIIEQSEKKLILDLVTEFEGEKFHFTLERKEHAWTQVPKE